MNDTVDVLTGMPGGQNNRQTERAFPTVLLLLRPVQHGTASTSAFSSGTAKKQKVIYISESQGEVDVLQGNGTRRHKQTSST